MKRLLLTFITIISMIIAGCKSIPSVEFMETTSRVIGTTAAIVANQTSKDMSREQRVIVVEIAKDIKTRIPATNQTLVATWEPIITAHIKEKLETRVITEAQADKISITFTSVLKGLEYILVQKHPEIREYSDRVYAAVEGFVDGFVANYIVDIDVLRGTTDVKIDNEAYNYMTR